LGTKLSFLNMDTLSIVLPAVMALAPHIKLGSGLRREKDRLRARDRAYKGKNVEPEQQTSSIDALMKLIPALTTALPALKAAATGADDASAQQAIERLQSVLSGSGDNTEELSTRLIELLPELLRVLTELNKMNPEAKDPNLEQVSEVLTEIVTGEQTAVDDGTE